MKTAHSRSGVFSRIGENLYRYTSSGVYYARYRNNGKLIHHSLNTTDREFAKRLLKEEISKINKVDSALGKMTLEELLKKYDESLGRYALKTAATRRSILKIFKETWTLGLDLKLKSISAGQIELWLGARRANFKNATYNEYARFIRHVFELAVKLRALPSSPAEEIKGLKVETPIRITPTWEQFQKIVAEIRSQKYSDTAKDTADLVEFMGLSGAGTAECASLKGEHIHFASNRITLYRQKTDTGFSIPIFPQLLPFLKRLDENGNFKQGQHVFHVESPKKALSAACERLKFPAFSPRSLRRCFITRAIELGVDFKTIASWQGHRDGGVLIAKTYSHLRNEHSDAMAQKLRTGEP
jgi:integrase